MTATPANKKAAPEIEVITMTDGRTVEFTGTRKKIHREASINDQGQIQVRFDFRNGETRLFTLPQVLLQKAAAHGITQKLSDEMAGIDNLDDQLVAFDDLVDRLYQKGLEGWTAEREAGANLAGASILVRALVELSQGTARPQTADQVRQFLAGKTHAEKLALRANSKIAPIVKRLEEEKAAKRVEKGTAIDSDALLGGLIGEESEAPAEAAAE